MGAWQLEQLAGVEAAAVERRALGPDTGCYERWQDVVYLYWAAKALMGRWYCRRRCPPPSAGTGNCCVISWGLLRSKVGSPKEWLATAALEQERTSKAVIAAISHDFRTPLATIIGASSMLLTQEHKLTGSTAGPGAAHLSAGPAPSAGQPESLQLALRLRGGD